ncbi:MAG: ATP-dependent DNA helicase, partial [Patescibacteria group bacterium]
DLQEKYQYILVDEHQDTNGAQNKALELLANYDKNPNLFVVGDEKQAIFRFQGASLENFIYFKNKFPRVKLINLKQNYRSQQHILDASHSLIEKNKAVLALTRLTAARSDLAERSIKIASFNNPETEHLFVAKKIKELVKQKTPPHEIALLYRENKDALSLSDFLTRESLAHVVESDENVLEDMEIKKLNILLATIENFGNDEHLIKALHLDFLNVDPLTLYKLSNQDVASLKLDILKKLGAWKKLSYNTTLPRFFETVINESGFLKNILARPDYREKLSKLHTVFGEIKKLATADHSYNLYRYLNHLEILKEHNLPLRSKIVSQTGVVRLMTAHKAKGLEFDYVFIVGTYNGHWGNKKNIKHFDLPIKTSFDSSKLEKNEDERRLFYMALTRARKNVFITYSTVSAEGREQVPSQFIGEIRPDLKEELTHPPKASYLRSDLNWHNDTGESREINTDKKEKEYVRELFLKRGLSPTSLNNYLTCPWRFFYVNLLRVPKTETRHQIYGTAKHDALQKFFDSRRENKKIGSKFLVDAFADKLKKLPLTREDHQLLHQKGQASLAAYYNFYKNIWNHNTVNEFKISGVDFPVGKSQTIRLTGKLDKLEIQDPGPKIQVTVVDYKTKTPESRNWILGRTKNSNGDYFRQLTFYKLLLDSLPRSKYKMKLGVIDFVEPDDKGRFRKETFEITTADMNELKETIARTADEIFNLKFWNKRCGKKDCGYCELRELLPYRQS